MNGVLNVLDFIDRFIQNHEVELIIGAGVIHVAIYLTAAFYVLCKYKRPQPKKVKLQLLEDLDEMK